MFTGNGDVRFAPVGAAARQPVPPPATVRTRTPGHGGSSFASRTPGDLKRPQTPDTQPQSREVRPANARHDGERPSPEHGEPRRDLGPRRPARAAHQCACCATPRAAGEPAARAGPRSREKPSRIGTICGGVTASRKAACLAEDPCGRNRTGLSAGRHAARSLVADPRSAPSRIRRVRQRIRFSAATPREATPPADQLRRTTARARVPAPPRVAPALRAAPPAPRAEEARGRSPEARRERARISRQWQDGGSSTSPPCPFEIGRHIAMREDRPA